MFWVAWRRQPSLCFQDELFKLSLLIQFSIRRTLSILAVEVSILWHFLTGELKLTIM